ncbi:MAG: FliA/WhiG family RNA polymerase sigma factor [Pseudomonadota bacterium]
MPPLAAAKLKKYGQTATPAGRKKDNKEREHLINKYAPLVKTIAGRLSSRLPSHVCQDDLLSSGIMGLLDAIDKFNPDKGVEFRSYAEFRIRGAMIDELRSMDWVPRSVRKNGKILQEAYLNVEKEKMRPATDEEVAMELGVDIETFHHMLEEVKGISIINEEEISDIFPQNNGAGPWPMNGGGSDTDPLGALKLGEVRTIIAGAIDKLPKNERMVVALYYYEEMTMKEVGTAMGYTESRVSQLHTKAVLRLRSALKVYFKS